MHWSLDDWEQYAWLPAPQVGTVIESPDKVLGMWTRELDAMRRHGCLLNLTMHPFLTGRPSRLEALRSLIEYAQSRDDVRFTRCRDLARDATDDPDLPIRTHQPPPETGAV